MDACISKNTSIVIQRAVICVGSRPRFGCLELPRAAYSCLKVARGAYVCLIWRNDFGVSDLAPCDLISRGVLDSNWGPLRLQQYQRYVF
jgi:hypothetical protein